MKYRRRTTCALDALLEYSLLAAVVLCAAPAAVGAQAPSVQNLYIADITYKDGVIRVERPRKLTGDKGINSQPSFTPDGRSILFVRRDSAAGQGDIYRIEIPTGKETRITSTPETENSPTVTPDGKLMVIRWKPETLFREWGPWIYDMQNGEPLAGVLPGPDTVGYYVRTGRSSFAMVRPTSRRSVAIFDSRTRTMTDYDWPVANLPPQKIPHQNAISYTRVDSVAGNHIRRLDLATLDTTEIAAALPGKIVHAWTPHGTILMSRGNEIFALTPPERKWTSVAQFDDPGLQDVNTYVVSPRGDKVVLISPLEAAH